MNSIPSLSLSQELFDETVLENEDVFELTAHEALQETVEQYKKSHLSLEHLVLSHPKDKNEERRRRKVYRQALDQLVRLQREQEEQEALWECLTTIQECHHSTTATHRNIFNRSHGLLVMWHQHEKAWDALLNSFCQQEAQDVLVLPRNTGPPTGSTLHGRALPLLVQTITALLTTTSTAPTISTTTTATAASTIIKMDREIQSTMKDRVNERCMKHCVTLVSRCLYGSSSLLASSSSTGNAAAVQLPNVHVVQMVAQLLQLAHLWCRSNEGNKLQWMQAAASPTTTATMTTANDKNDDNCHRHGIDMVLQVLCCRFQEDNKQQGATKHGGDSNRNVIIQMQIRACQLITTLCRFDDWRPLSSAAAAAGAAGDSGPLMPTCSSAHNHVLEWSKHGAVPILYRLAVLAASASAVGNNNDGNHDARNKLVSGGGGTANNGNGNNDDKNNDEIDDTVDDVTTEDIDNDDESNQQAGNSDSNDTTAAAATTASTPVQQQHLLTHALSALRALAIQNDVVQSMVAVGVLDLVQTILDTNLLQQQNVQVLAATCGLIRNLCANDEIKSTLCGSSSSRSIVVEGMLHAMQSHPKHALLQEHGCGTMAAMALRSPNNSTHLVQQHACHLVILQAMRMHADHTSIQRQGALALRNLASRRSTSNVSGSGELLDIRQMLLDAGAEQVLMQAGKYQQSVDEAYAALRELGCDKVQVLKVDPANGKTTVARSRMFGEGTLNFRPVLEESSNDAKHG